MIEQTSDPSLEDVLAPMTEPLKVDTDGLDAASAILKSAAGQIPTQLPQFSVNGSDPLSAAIAAGSAQMEAPMAALPWIQANATTAAEKIGVAGQRYRETDETLAQKAKEQQFDKNAQEIDGSAQEIKGLSHSQAAIEQLTRTMTEGGATGSPGQKSVTDTLLDNIADGGKAAGAGPAGVPGSLMPDKTDWILGGAGATGQAFADKIAELTRRSLATGGDGASPTLKKLVEEIKNPFTFLGKDTPALGSKPGGIVGVYVSGKARMSPTTGATFPSGPRSSGSGKRPRRRRPRGRPAELRPRAGRARSTRSAASACRQIGALRSTTPLLGSGKFFDAPR
jgi:hypothetical protein